MKVALVHDYLKEYGGAERVLEALHEVYPDATVFTSVYIPRFLGPHRGRFKGWKIKTSWLQYVPFKHKLISPFRLLTPWVFKQFDFSEFDVVIVSATGAYFPNVIRTKGRVSTSSANKNSSLSERSESKGSGPIHICYCHTPPRYLYGYATAREWKNHKVYAAVFGLVAHFLRMVDFNASKHVDYYIANSQEVAGRIKKFYRRDSTVIYPPIEIQGLGTRGQGLGRNKQTKPYNLEPRTYFLTGGRLARTKHVDVIVKACSELGVPLKVFGKGFAGYGEELRAMAGPSVKFVGEVSDEERNQLMQGAKAFLFAAEEEDFGIVPVEAMALGTPVIAYKSGGVKETVVDKKTGVFFDALSVSSLKEAIKQFEKLTIKSEDCRKQAEKFSKERFIQEIKAFVDKKTNISI